MVLIEITLLVFLFFEFYYFLRVLFCFIYVSALNKLKGCRKIDEESVVYGVCTTTDLDVLLHMNNTRYLREMDFGRMDFFGRNGIFLHLRNAGNGLVMSACSIRYRRSVTPFQVFRIRTKLLYWDDRNFYVEHRLETIHDNFVRAVSIVKQTIVGSMTVPDVLGHLAGDTIERPPLTAEVEKWIQSNELSSQRFRTETKQETPSRKDSPPHDKHN